MTKTANSNLMSYLEKTVKFFSTYTLLPGIVAIFVIYFSSTLYEVKTPPISILLAFLTAFAVYNLNKITDHTEDTINKPNKNTKKQLYHTTTAILCYTTTLIISITKGTQIFLTCLIPLIIGFIYSVKISKSLHRLKEILYIKNISVAFSLAFTGTLLPTFTNTTIISTEKIIMIFLYIFIQFFTNTVLFDIVDTPGDKAANIKTIPIRLGKQKTTYLLLLINSLLIPWLITIITTGMFTKYLPATIFGILYSYGIILYFTKKERKRHHAETLIDGAWLPIIILLLLTPH